MAETQAVGDGVPGETRYDAAVRRLARIPGALEALDALVAAAPPVPVEAQARIAAVFRSVPRAGSSDAA